MGCGWGEGPGFGVIGHKELWVSCTRVLWCSEPAADPSPQEAGAGW